MAYFLGRNAYFSQPRILEYLGAPGAAAPQAQTQGGEYSQAAAPAGGAQRPDPNLIRRREQQAGGGGFDVRGCIEGCERQFPMHYKDALQKEDYDECVRICNQRGEEFNEGGGEEQPEEGEVVCPPEAEASGKEAHEGCPCKSRFYVNSKDFQCPPGYKMVVGSHGPSCRCIKWCNDLGLGEACLGRGAEGETGALGEFQWPQELTDLYMQLLGRAGSLLERKPGFSDEILNLMFGQNFDKIRGMERATRESVLGNLGREGMLGTGTALEALNKTAWGTERNIGDLRRDLTVLGADRELSDLLQQTQAAQNLFGQGVGFQQLLEAINASRRGEGRDMLSIFMSFINSLMASWAA